MKKTLRILALVVASATLFACGEITTSPKVFNDTAMRSFKAANDALEKFDAKITESVKGSDLAAISPAAETALAEVDAQIAKVEALNNPQGEAYKQAILGCLAQVKDIIETGKKYADLKKGYSNSEFNALEKEYNNKRKDLSNGLKNVATAQSEFAKAVSN